MNCIYLKNLHKDNEQLNVFQRWLNILGKKLYGHYVNRCPIATFKETIVQIKQYFN